MGEEKMLKLDLADFYAGIEDKWFAFIEALEKRGIPARVYTDFFEDKGIPSLPATLTILLLLLSLFVIPVPAQGGSILHLSVRDDVGNALQETFITIEVNNKIVEKRILSDSQDIIPLKQAVLGSTIHLTAYKNGYKKFETEAKILSENTFLKIVLEKQRQCSEARFRFVDEKTGQPINNVAVKISVEENVFSGSPGKNGIVFFSCIPDTENALLLVRAPGYEDYREVVNLKGGKLLNRKLDRSATALSGEASIKVEVIDMETKEKIENAKIKIFDSETGKQLNENEEESSDGEYYYSLPAGTMFYLLVEKKGYVLFKTEPVLAVAGKKDVRAELKKGSKQLRVIAFDESGNFLQGARILLTDSTGFVLSESETDFSGIAVFEGMDPNKEYKIVAWKPGFLTGFENAVQGRTATENELNVVLKNQVKGEEKTLLLKKNGESVRNGVVKAFIEENGVLFPLGFGELKTDISGQIKVVVPKNSKIVFKAETELEQAIIEFEPEEKTKEAELERKTTIKTIFFVDEKNQPVNGIAVITGIIDGEEVLASKKLVKGKISFDSKAVSEVDIKLFESEDSMQPFFEETKRSLEGNKEIRVRVISESAVLEPKISFLGVYDSFDKKLEKNALNIEQEYYLWFSVSFPEIEGVEEGGFMLVAGPPEVNVLSQKNSAFISWAQLPVESKISFGETFSPTTNNPAIDTSEMTQDLIKAKKKWFQAVIPNASGEKILKFKVKALEFTNNKKAVFYYRAWTKVGGKYFRNPEDKELGNNKDSKKAGLYAKLKKIEIDILAEKPLCSTEVCYSIKVETPEHELKKPELFEAEKGKKYILIVSLKSNTNKALTRKLLFKPDSEKGEIKFFEESIENNAQASNQKLVATQLSPFQEKSLRIGFTPESTASQQKAGIRILVSDEREAKLSESKTIRFFVSGNKELLLEVKPVVSFGRNTIAVLKDKETNEFITNAKISVLSESNEKLEAVVGTNSFKRGANGEYQLETLGLLPGIYRVKAEKDGFKTKEKEIIVSSIEIIDLPKISRIDIEKTGEKETAKKTIEIKVRNNSAYKISSASIETSFDPGLQGLFDFKINSFPETLEAGEIGKIIAEATYLKDKSNRAYSGVTITYAGMVDNRVLTSSSARITITYNKQISRECIGLDKTEMQVFSLLEKNSTGEGEVYIKNVCSDIVNFAVYTKPVSDSKQQENIKVLTDPASFVLSQGKEIALKITIQNNAELSGTDSLNLDYLLVFDSPKIQVELPLRVTLRNSLSVLQTNNNIVVPMAKIGKTNILTGVTPLFVRNISSEQVRSLSYRVVKTPENFFVFVVPYYAIESVLATYQNSQNLFNSANAIDVSIGRIAEAKTREEIEKFSSPLDLYSSNTNNPFQSVLENPFLISDSTIAGLATEKKILPAINPKQSISPPLAIIVFSPNLAAKKMPGLIQIELIGTILGQKKVLKNISVWPNVFEASCLSIESKSNINFLSQKTGAVLLKEITVNNQCFEPVKIVGLTPTKIGSNSLEIGPGKTIQPSTKEKFTIVLNAKNPYFNEGSPDEVKVRGLLINSQRFIESNPLSIEAKIGKETAGLTGPKTSPIEVPICGETSKTTISPPAIGEDCTQSYCDAKNLASFISNKISFLFEKTKSRLNAAGNRIENFSACDPSKEFCEFKDLGVRPETMTVFISRDNMSNILLEQELESQPNPEVKKFVVNYFDFESKPELSGFTVNQVLLNNAIQGCGKTTIQVSGAVQNIQGKLSMSNSVFFVKTGETIKTAQCTIEMQNIATLSPLDLGLKGINTSQSFATLIESDEKLLPAAREIAGELVKDTSRAQTQARSTKIRLEFEKIKEGGIAKISINPQTATSPITFNLQINRQQEGLSSTELQSIGKQVGKALKELFFNPKNVDYCIDKTKNYVVLKSFTPSGSISIEGPTTIKVSSGKTCTGLNNSFKVLSSSPDTVNVSFTPKTSEGIKKISLNDLAGGKIFSNTSVLPLTENPNKNGFYFPFEMCVEGDNSRIGSAHNKTINLKAKSVNSSNESDFFPVKLQVCGVHPYSLIKRMKSTLPKKNSETTRYAVIGWTGEPETISLQAINNALKATQRKEIAEKKSESEPGITLKSTSLEDQDRLSIGAYFATCSAVAGACGFTRFGIIGSTWNIAFDCGLPAGVAFMKTFEAGRNILNKTKNFLNPVKEFFEPIVSPVTGFFKELWEKQKEFVGNALNGIFGRFFGDEQESAQKFNDNILGTAIFGVELRAIINGLTADIASVPVSSPEAEQAIKTASKQLSNKFAADFSEEQLKGVSPETQAEIRSAISEPVEKNIEQQLKQAAKTSGNKTIGEIAPEALQKGLGSSADDVARALGSNIDEIKDTPLGKKIVNAQKGTIQELFKVEEISASTADDFVRAGGKITTTNIEEISNRAAATAIQKIGLEEETPKGMQEFMKTQIKNSIREDPVFKNALSKGAKELTEEESKTVLNNSLKKALFSTQSKYGEIIQAKIGKSILSEMEAESVKRTRPSRIKNFFGRGRAFMRGLTCGAIANAAGYAASRYVSKSQQTNSYADESIRLVNGEITGDTSIKKFQTYKIKVLNNNDKISYLIEEVISANQEQEMQSKINSDSSTLWEDNCGEFYQTPVSSLIGGLAPNPENPNIKPEAAIAYYKNARFFANAANSTGLPEELIVALMLHEPEAINSCTVSRNWPKLEPEKIKEKIDCIAKSFSELLLEKQNNLDKALSDFASPQTSKQEYINRVKALRDIWAGEKVSQ